MSRQLYTIEEAAKLMALSHHTVRKLCQRHQIATVKLGSAVRIEATVLDQYIAERRIPTVGESAGSPCVETIVPVSEEVRATR